jgi:hypothetical protein
MMMTVMIAHAAAPAKPSLKLTRIGQAILSATLPYRPSRRTVSARPSYRPRCRIGQQAVAFARCGCPNQLQPVPMTLADKANWLIAVQMICSSNRSSISIGSSPRWASTRRASFGAGIHVIFVACSYPYRVAQYNSI